MSKHSHGIMVSASESAQLIDPNAITKTANQASKSPIDEYYEFVQGFFPHASRMLHQDHYSGITLLALISAVETYTRHLASECINYCPLTRKHCGPLDVKIGSLSYYSNKLGRAILEVDSLAGSENIKNFLSASINFAVPKNSSLAAALHEFDKICQLRHAAVHSRGYLTYGNASRIGINDLSNERIISLSPISYQEVYQVTNNVVRAINSSVFNTIIDRWLDNSIIIGDWNTDKDKWNQLLFAFYSYTDDPEAGKNKYQIYRRAQPIAKRIFAARQARIHAVT